MDMDLSNHILLPREDFIELQTAAWDMPALPMKDRMSNVLGMTLTFMGVAAAISLGTWGWASALNWREKRAFERRMIELSK